MARYRRLCSPAALYRATSLPVSGCPYAICTWLPIMILDYIDGRRLLSHLKMHHHQQWEHLTWAFGAPGGRNGFRMLPWLFSSEDHGDATLARFKSAHRQLLVFTLVVFLSYLILTPILGA